jgi:hypothetical protein
VSGALPPVEEAGIEHHASAQERHREHEARERRAEHLRHERDEGRQDRRAERATTRGLVGRAARA